MNAFKLHGPIMRFGDDVNTDYIISSKHKSRVLDMKELATYIMEDIRPGFYQELRGGDILVAGENFGCGSSRETAAIVLKEAGISAVVAKSFGRIFYRNAINIGLPLAICDTDGMEEGMWLSLDLDEGIAKLDHEDSERPVGAYPDQVKQIMLCGGVKGWLAQAGFLESGDEDKPEPAT